MPIVRARQTFFTANNGKVNQGDLLRSDDPIVTVRPELFESVESVVEQATAAPGEKRSLPRKAAAKKAAS